MGKINSRSKGQRGEREIVKVLQSALDDVFGAGAYFVERNQNQSNAGGCDIVGVPLIAPEVKFCERFAIPQWWLQCKYQADAINLSPVLFYRKSRVAWRVRFEFGFIGGWESMPEKGFIMETSLEDFLNVYKRKLFFLASKDKKEP